MPSIRPSQSAAARRRPSNTTSSEPSNATPRWAPQSKLQLKVCRITGDVQDPRKLSNSPILHQRELNWRKLNEYLIKQDLKDITTELTIGAITNLDGIAGTFVGRKIRRLVLVANPATFPYGDLTMMKAMLRNPLTKLTHLRTVVVRMQRVRDSDRELDRMMCINCIAGALKAVRFVRLREIRLEMDEVHDWKHVLAACTSKSQRKGAPTRWSLWWNSLQRLHIVGNFTSGHPEFAWPRGTTLREENEVSAEYARKQGPILQAALSVKPTADWIQSLAKLRGGPATVRADKVIDGDYSTRSTVYFEHESASAPKSKSILDAVKGVHKMGIRGKLDPVIRATPMWQWGQGVLTQQSGLQHLKLTMENADADVICNLIERNQNCLQHVWLEVSLARGTWDQVFVALAKCPLLWYVRAGPKGLAYASGNNRIKTGYLKAGCRLPNEVIRHADRHALSSLLSKIQHRRQGDCTSCSAAESRPQARSRAQRVEQLMAPAKEHRCSVIDDTSWSSVMIDYAGLDEYHLDKRYAARRQSDSAMWQHPRWAGTGRGQAVQQRKSLPAEALRPSGQQPSENTDQTGPTVPAAPRQPRQRASWPGADNGRTAQRRSPANRELRRSARLRVRTEGRA